MATWPACGQKSYITPTVSGSPTLIAELNPKWLGSPRVGTIATSPLLSRGSPTLIAGTISRMAWWPACGQNSYTTPAVPGLPNAHCGE